MSDRGTYRVAYRVLGRRPDSEPGTGHSDDNEPARQPRNPAQLDSVGQGEAVCARGTGRGDREGRVGDLVDPDGPRWPSPGGGVDGDDQVVIVDHGHQAQRVEKVEHLNRGCRAADGVGDKQTDRIVPAVWMTAAHHQGSRHAERLSLGPP